MTMMMGLAQCPAANNGYDDRDHYDSKLSLDFLRSAKMIFINLKLAANDAADDCGMLFGNDNEDPLPARRRTPAVAIATPHARNRTLNKAAEIRQYK